MSNVNLVEGYIRLAGLYGLDRSLALSTYRVIYDVKGLTRAYCLGHMPLETPSLPPPDDVRVQRYSLRYAKLLREYLRVLRTCSEMYSIISRMGVGGVDSFYLYHLADIASARLSGALALGLRLEDEIVDVTTMDLKEVELNIYNMVTGVKWVTGPIIAAYEHSPGYRAIVDRLKGEGYDLGILADSIASTEVPKLREELLEWFKGNSRLVMVTLRPLARKRARWRFTESTADLAGLGDKFERKMEKVLGYQALTKTFKVLASREGGVVENLALCTVARDAADYSGLYTYLLVSRRTLNYIRNVWRPYKCPYPHLKWPLQDYFKDYVAGSRDWSEVASIARRIVKMSTTGKIEIPDSVVERYVSILEIIASRIRQGGLRS